MTSLKLKKGPDGSTNFANDDDVYNMSDSIINTFVNEGIKNTWFAKLPTHEQLLRRVTHVFSNLAKDSDTVAKLSKILMTPRQLTFVWHPLKAPLPLKESEPVAESSIVPSVFFDESESESESDNIPDSNLPEVALQDDESQNHEEYLLARLRAAKARVEIERARMMYFEATGRMPPDSDSDSDSKT